MNVCESTVYAIDVHAPAAFTDVHTFIVVPPAHDAPFVHVVCVPPPLLPPLLPPPPLLLPLPPPLPLPPEHAVSADSAALVQSAHELH